MKAAIFLVIFLDCSYPQSLSRMPRVTSDWPWQTHPLRAVLWLGWLSPAVRQTMRE
jgi:hypothetical protein